MLKVILKKGIDSEKFLQEVKKRFIEDRGYKGLVIDGEGDFTYRDVGVLNSYVCAIIEKIERT